MPEGESTYHILFVNNHRKIPMHFDEMYSVLIKKYDLNIDLGQHCLG